MSKKVHVSTSVNQEPVEFLCEPRQSLLEVLRDTLRLTGAKEGCNNGNCGACTVIFDGEPVNSCLVLAVEAEGATVETVEGLADHGHLHPIQKCFLEAPRSSAGSARPVSWWPPKLFSTATHTPRSTKSALLWPTISAVAQVTTRSLGPCKRPRNKCGRWRNDGGSLAAQ